ncbi:MAG: hypothetical protein RIS70_604 [Planctomycetota bacterium]
MTEVVFVNVRDAARAIHARISREAWEHLQAALAADPETIEELTRAMSRFRLGSSSEPGPLETATPGENWDRQDPTAVVDLAARLVAVDERVGEVSRSDYVEISGEIRGKQRTVVLDYKLSPDWQLNSTLSGWAEQAKERRAKRTAPSIANDRAVLYGELVRFLVEHQHDPAIQAAEDRVAALHAAWLTTPREDLGGRTPREALIREIDRIERDIETRSRQWSYFGECPVGVEPSSAAYRNGPPGRHEFVMYYDLVRYLLGKLLECREVPDNQPTADEIQRLTRLQIEWMQTPIEDFGGRTPFNVIDDERRRIPPIAGSDEACIDPNCPICRMMADGSFGPTFWYLDGSHIDDEFVFSCSSTESDWESVRYSWASLPSSLGSDLASTEGSLPPKSRVWQYSQMNEKLIQEIPPQQRMTLILFGIGGHMAELAEDARQDNDAKGNVMKLLDHFEDLRGAIRDRMHWLSRSLIEQCCDVLEGLASLRPGWAEKCWDLQRKFLWLDELVESWSREIDVPF